MAARRPPAPVVGALFNVGRATPPAPAPAFAPRAPAAPVPTVPPGASAVEQGAGLWRARVRAFREIVRSGSGTVERAVAVAASEAADRAWTAWALLEEAETKRAAIGAAGKDGE